MSTINEHDKTKQMIDVIRGSFGKKTLTESNEYDTITPTKGDPVFNDEYKKLSQIVDPSIEITNFKIYVVDKNVIIEGNMLNNKAQFKMVLRDDEVKIDTGTINLNDSNNEILKKLQGYFKNWKDEWNKKINTEYNQRRD